MRALIEEATRRSAVVWVRPDGVDRFLPLWHVWHDGRAYVVTGGLEQPFPAVPPGSSAVVAVRSKATQSDRLVQWVATVEPVAVGTAEWDQVVPLLHTKRLNARDGAQQPARWATESTVLRLTPTGQTVPLPDGSGAAAPVRGRPASP